MEGFESEIQKSPLSSPGHETTLFYIHENRFFQFIEPLHGNAASGPDSIRSIRSFKQPISAKNHFISLVFTH